MSKLSKNVMITEFDVYNERIEFGNKYVVNNTRKGSEKVTWSDQLVSLLAFTYFKDKKPEKTEVYKHQERSYDRMKLSLSHKTSFSSESLKNPNQTVFIDQHLPSLPRKLTKNGSIDSLSEISSRSDTISESSALGSLASGDDTSSLSSCDSGSLDDINSSKVCETTRVIERFGNGFRDKCLFPLALSLDLTDLTKGRITWESISSKADLVLDKWCSQYSRKVNRVFASAIDQVCPEPSLQNRFLLCPKTKPLKRWNSYEDLYSLKRQTMASNDSISALVSTDDSFYTRKEFKRIEKSDINRLSTDCLKRKLSDKSDDSNELIILDPISSPLFIKRPSIVQNRKVDPKSLLRNIRANSPLQLALYITEIDKQFFLQLTESQLFHCMIGGSGLNQKKGLNELKDLMDFGSELNKFVVSIIRKQITPETQGVKIAGFIEVACILRKLRNWNSLVNIIRALQSPKIFFMEEAWMAMKKTFPVHFSDYLKLCRLVRMNETCIIGSTIGSSIPSLASLLYRISIHCIATWDLLENKRRWTEQPSIAGWVNNELIGQLVESQKRRQKQEERYMLSLDGSPYTLLPDNDPIRLIQYSSLPSNWTKRDIKYITYSYLKPIVKCFQTSFNREINAIRQYNIPSARI